MTDIHQCSCDLGLPCGRGQHQYKANSTSWVCWTFLVVAVFVAVDVLSLAVCFLVLGMVVSECVHYLDRIFVPTLEPDGLWLETYLVRGLGCGRDTTHRPRRWFFGVRHRSTQQKTEVEKRATAANLRSKKEFRYGNRDERGGADLHANDWSVHDPVRTA